MRLGLLLPKRCFSRPDRWSPDQAHERGSPHDRASRGWVEQADEDTARLRLDPTAHRPRRAASRRRLSGGFVLFEDLPDTDPFVHLELLTHPITIDDPTQVDTYRRAFLRLLQTSTVGNQAEELIRQASGCR
ncbi:hypothetical protein FRACA_2800006 [Frankia canadensis]|uniref:DUF5753 domain-containing protein n=1 Tax=Frankia canadensis TaxID=1836972 RepID=A0A2I2KT39_9ACTN|nr:hypothetical protein FRACA_2800006 [Frankia canadensis]SOU56115.1 hypothetical protein FRACA_2800006 [Frankia canadensis]